MPAEPVIQEITVVPGQYTVTATLSSTDVTVLPTIQEVNIRAGIRGPAGPAGADGPAGANGSNVVWLGEWTAGTYDALDGVQYLGSAWVANKTTTATPPSTPAGTSADWDLFTAKGDTGATGAKGDTGDTGPTGPEGAGYLHSGTTENAEVPNTGTFLFSPVSGSDFGAYTIGARARAINADDQASWIEGVVTSAGGTLAIDSDLFEGTTAGTTWNISIAGVRGATGATGSNGTNGTDGNDGWTPELAVVSDGDRRVQQVVDWFGGESTKPATGQYVGATGLVSLIADAVDIRGPVGSGSGDVTGPASSTAGNFAVFADTTGKEIADGGTPGDGATADFGSTAGTICEGNDARLADARTPTAHASSHVTGGTDKIRDATASQDGLMTAAYASKLDGIKALSDVTGPASSTDNAIARFNGTGGKDIQNSGITISDTNDVAGVDSLAFDTAAAVTLTAQGQMAWNADEETVDVLLNGFVMHTGEHLLYHAKNQTGNTIAKGVPVMFAGTDGTSGKLLIQPWNGTGPSVYFMGLTAEELLNDEEGFVIAFGKLRGIQTNGGNYSQTWTDGEVIYAGTTTGSLTDTAPAAPNPRIIVCAVISAHASNGTLFIRPTLGSNIKDDEGVTINSLASGQLLIANAAGTVFENKTVSGDATLTNAGALTIANDAVSNAKLANMAEATIKGRAAGAGTGDPTDLSATQATAILNAFVGDSGSGGTKGLVPAPAAGDAAAGKYLDADGTWTVPAGGGGGSTLQYAQLGSQVDITDNATLQSITGLSFSMAANTSYRIRFHMAVSASATSTGYEIGITGPASPTGYFSIVSLWNSATAETATITNSTSYGSIGANANSGGGTARPCEGIILFHNGANAGTFQLQGKVENAVSGTVSFEVGSFMTWEEVTT